jgi:hypothetical protein
MTTTAELLVRAQQHQHAGQLDRAEQLYRQIVQQEPESAVAHDNLGNVLREQERLPEAAQSYWRAIGCDPTFGLAYAHLGGVLGFVEDLDTVLAGLEKVRPASPDGMTPRELHEFHQWFYSTYIARLSLRYPTFYQAMVLAVARKVRAIVETGTTRDQGNWAGDGQSTCIFGAFAQRYGCRVWTCDIDPSNIERSRRITAEFGDRIDYVVSDSVAFLAGFDQPIDFLYLDSFDFDLRGDPNPSQDHALREGQAAQRVLHERSLILVDDCGLVHGGKGGKVIPFLTSQGWKIIDRRYQVLLARAGLSSEE